MQVASGDVIGMTVNQLALVNSSSAGLEVLQTFPLGDNITNFCQCYGPLIALPESVSSALLLCDFAVIEVHRDLISS